MIFHDFFKDIPILKYGKTKRILGALHLFTELISGAGANVSGAERNGSERSWNNLQSKRNEGGIDRMERSSRMFLCLFYAACMY